MSLTSADLMMMPQSDLDKVAKGLRVKTSGLNRDQVLDAVYLAAIRKEEDVRRQVNDAQRTAKLLELGIESKTSKRPAPENIAILASKKVRVRFLNREDPPGEDGVGTDITFRKGGFEFHLWDDKDHILPECLVVEAIEEIPEVTEKVKAFFVASGMKPPKAEETAKGVMRRLSLPITCQKPIYAEKKLATGETVSQIVSWRRRFDFIHSKNETPKNAEFGVVESEVVHA